MTFDVVMRWTDDDPGVVAVEGVFDAREAAIRAESLREAWAHPATEAAPVFGVERSRVLV